MNKVLIQTWIILLVALYACQPIEKQNSENNKPTTYAIVGTYTQKEPHVDGKGAGIILFDADSASNKWKALDTFSQIINPSYLCLSPNHPIIYAVSEQGPQAQAPQSVIQVIQLDTVQQQMQLLQTVSALGHAPCYISTDRTGKHLLVANYVSGNIVHYVILPDGTLSKEQSVQHQAKGPHSRQESSHLHFINQLPGSDDFFAVDLGGDAIWRYQFKDDSLLQMDSISTMASAGPRHLAGHPSGHGFYVLNELSGTIEAWKKTGDTYTRFQNISLLPASSKGIAGAADIHISLDGRYVYASLRGDFNQLLALSVDAQTLQLKLLQRMDAGGKVPRNFALSPDNKNLAVALQDSDIITIFNRNQKTGMLELQPTSVPVQTPVVIKFWEF